MPRVLFVRRRLAMALAVAMGLAGACSRAETVVDRAASPQSVRFGAVSYQARARVEAATRSGPLLLRTTLTLTNEGGSPQEAVVPPGCLLTVKVRHVGGARAWDQVEWRAAASRASGFILACADTGARFHLPSGARATVLSRDAPTVADILGDSLPEGEYEVTATLFPPPGSPHSPSEVSAGRVRLTRS